jgi:hypothetical protein
VLIECLSNHVQLPENNPIEDAAYLRKAARYLIKVLEKCLHT